jgi:hypothetical protein
VSVWNALRRILNADIGGTKKPAPKTPAPRPSRASQAPGPGFQVLQSPDQPPVPTMKWQRERAGPRIRGQGFVPPSVRKRILIALAGLCIVAMLVLAVARLVVDRRLPSQVTGLWRTDAPAYQGRLVELRSRYLAFLTDSAGGVVSYKIARVLMSQDAQGTLFRVQYDANGKRSEFAFVYDQGPPEHLRFAHQRQLVWRRERSDRSLMIR